MGKYDEVNIEKIMNTPRANTELSRFAKIYDAMTMKKISDISGNSALTEIQKMFSRYDEILKPLHMELLGMIGELIEEQTAGIKKYDLSGFKSFIEDGGNKLEENAYNISGTIRALNEIMEPLKTSASFSKINEMSANISGCSTILQEADITSLISQILKNNATFWALSQKTLKDVNINLLGKVTEQVFSESEDWNIDTVSETISSEYKKATDISLNRENQNLPITEKRKIEVKEIREWFSLIVAVVSLVLEIVNSSSTTINNYNYVQQVNNYYIVGMGYDAKELNATKYRIVNRESIVRLKHDCHSTVIGKLEEGQVIRIIDKYKKWKQIIWEDEDGERYMGWIQNYKLSEFKIPKGKWQLEGNE